MLTNMSDEYAKFKARLAQVGDHGYVLDLRHQIADSKEQIAMIQK